MDLISGKSCARHQLNQCSPRFRKATVNLIGVQRRVRTVNTFDYNLAGESGCMKISEYCVKIDIAFTWYWEIRMTA